MYNDVNTYAILEYLDFDFFSLKHVFDEKVKK